jgi:hypothetical protein
MTSRHKNAVQPQKGNESVTNMKATTKPLTQRKAWKALAAHHKKLQKLHLRQLFAEDPKR